MEKITGKNNEIVKNVKKLFTSSAQRRAQGLFVIEGARLVFDVLVSSRSVEYFFVTDEAYEKYKSKCAQMIEISKKSYLISGDISHKLSDTQNPQGVFAVCKIEKNAFEFKPNGKYIALDNIQDPGNLGTIIRTAEALGIDAVIVSGGCDIYNPKALRASMGSVLRMNIVECERLNDFIKEANDRKIKTYAAVPDSSAISITNGDFNEAALCVIGNEANGISRDIISACSERVTVPMLGKAESLNAHTAAAIVMWEMLR